MALRNTMFTVTTTFRTEITNNQPYVAEFYKLGSAQDFAEDESLWESCEKSVVTDLDGEIVHTSIGSFA